MKFSQVPIIREKTHLSIIIRVSSVANISLLHSTEKITFFYYTTKIFFRQGKKSIFFERFENNSILNLRSCILQSPSNYQSEQTQETYRKQQNRSGFRDYTSSSVWICTDAGCRSNVQYHWISCAENPWG